MDGRLRSFSRRTLRRPRGSKADTYISGAERLELVVSCRGRTTEGRPTCRHSDALPASEFHPFVHLVGLQRSADDHAEIVAAIAAKDPNAASAAMGRHVENIRKSTLQVMSEG